MNIKIIFLLAASILSYSSIVHTAEDQSLNLRAAEVHESCHELAAGMKLNYSFQSSSETLFNIHYHDGKVVSYPVAKQKTSGRNGTLTADSSRSYCLMWSNPQTITLTLRYKVDLPGN